MSSGIEDGNRKYYMIRTVRSMLERQMPPDQILTSMEQENRAYFSTPMTREELIYLIQDTQRNVEQERVARELAEKKK